MGASGAIVRRIRVAPNVSAAGFEINGTVFHILKPPGDNTMMNAMQMQMPMNANMPMMMVAVTCFW